MSSKLTSHNYAVDVNLDDMQNNYNLILKSKYMIIITLYYVLNN